MPPKYMIWYGLRDLTLIVLKPTVSRKSFWNHSIKKWSDITSPFISNDNLGLPDPPYLGLRPKKCHFLPLPYTKHEDLGHIFTRSPTLHWNPNIHEQWKIQIIKRDKVNNMHWLPRLWMVSWWQPQAITSLKKEGKDEKSINKNISK